PPGDEMSARPRLMLTMGDVAGIGPEIIARGWPALHAFCRPVVVGDEAWLRHALALVRTPAEIQLVGSADDAAPAPGVIPLLPGSVQNLDAVVVGQVSAAAGKAAYDFLCLAVDETLAGRAEGIVTAPLHKEGLHAAGVAHPGHTEILAER